MAWGNCNPSLATSLLTAYFGQLAKVKSIELLTIEAVVDWGRQQSRLNGHADDKPTRIE